MLMLSPLESENNPTEVAGAKSQEYARKKTPISLAMVEFESTRRVT